MNQSLGIFDYLFLFCITSIWIMILINIILTIGGYIYYIKTLKFKIDKPLDKYPMVSIIVPAHNEERVIEKTVISILNMSYPKDRAELIVVNDNSSDRTRKILENVKANNNSFKMTIVNTDKENGGRGKSNALNIGYGKSIGDFVVVYDADNTPEKNALKILVNTIVEDKSLGAVIGKFRTRNKDKNLLTKFINIETLGFQWMVQAGRWQFFKISTIPGTNFIIRKSVIDKIGGWDSKAIAEDTEISFRIYRKGYRIKYMPLSVTWEQEPERVDVWIRQRSRWVKGNIYVLIKNFKLFFSKESRNIKFDLLYFASVYFFFLGSTLISDSIFLLGILGSVRLTIAGNTLILWLMAYIVFILQISITLSMEKGESNYKNVILIAVMYFTYCQLWLFVAIKGIFQYTKECFMGTEVKWYKTERF